MNPDVSGIKMIVVIYNIHYHCDILCGCSFNGCLSVPVSVCVVDRGIGGI